MKINSAVFITSVADTNNLLDDALPQVAFVGRSNVGKSSLLNYLVGNKKLAKTSQTPGRTRLVNYFLINENIYFVDLPGYGFQKGSKTESAKWQALIQPFLTNNNRLKLVCLLVDGRHPPFDTDIQMAEYLSYYNIPFMVVATKCDKIPKSKQHTIKGKIATTLSLGHDDIIISSADGKIGREEILKKIKKYTGV